MPASPVIIPASPAAPLLGWHERPAPISLLHQRLLRDQPWAVLRADKAKALEQEAAQALPPHTLMQRAGLGVARLALAVAPHARRIWIVCGPGNNGGDGLEAALHLQQLSVGSGQTVTVCLAADAARLPADAAASLRRAQAAGVRIETGVDAPPLTAGDLVIDALLGRGLTRPAQGRLAALIDQMNAAAAPVLAVDLPSGLPGDTGMPAEGAACVQARWTLALLSLSPGLFTGQGRDLGADLWWDDLGVPASAGEPDAWLASGPSLHRHAAPRRHGQHKGSFGDVWAVGGAQAMGGAIHLAGRAALSAGAGRVYLVQPAGNAVDMAHPELMTSSWDAVLGDDALHARLAAGTVIAGCGGGAEIAQALPNLLAHAKRLVLDADGLNAVAADVGLRQALRARAQRGLPSVITPHPLEAARLLGLNASEVQSDRLAHASRLADALQAVVVLKGSGTVVARPGAAPWIHPVGNAALATPGSGDVLAGWTGGLWSGASKHTAAAIDAAWDAARLAVWQHGRAAETARPDGRPLPASALVHALARLGQEA